MALKNDQKFNNEKQVTNTYRPHQPAYQSHEFYQNLLSDQYQSESEKNI